MDVNKRTAAIIDFVGKNFAATSAVVFAIGVVSSTLFLYGYLHNFGNELIWYIEYPDLFKFFLIAVSFNLAFILFLTLLLNQFIGFMRYKSLLARAASIVIFSVIALALFDFAVSFRSSPDGEFISTDFSAFFVIFITITAIFYRIYRFVSLGIYGVNITIDVPLIAFSSLLAGNLFAYYTHSTAKYLDSVVLEKRTIDDVQIVFFTSHHAILLASDGTTIVVPTDEIREIRHLSARTPGVGLAHRPGNP
ncbi:hypothetical protein [Mesorhizobium sp. B1-1-8]|uniref:hypothetical protein n=1 Tax=Mesorhizobium sp. B1-1-8 TaxID=2589976 RepID=UPI001125FEC4|nr:hypothetical protein [Mesorhizobium sp. B1-1-8]UCI06008.1 hypothetical protein FJ974_19535 [Mesorhizobium sp. B1-1-8]